MISGQKLTPYMLSRLSKALSEKLKTKVRIVEKSSNLKVLAGQLLMPIRILGVNMLWLPDGSWESIVRIPKYEAKMLPAKKEVIEKLLSKLAGLPVKIRFE